MQHLSFTVVKLLSQDENPLNNTASVEPMRQNIITQRMKKASVERVERKAGLFESGPDHG